MTLPHHELVLPSKQVPNELQKYSVVLLLLFLLVIPALTLLVTGKLFLALIALALPVLLVSVTMPHVCFVLFMLSLCVFYPFQSQYIDTV
jgi:hypothetical protein